MLSGMPIHPAAELFPSMSISAFRELVEDIRVNGQAEPIWLYQGAIIDGRHRYKACQELNLPPLTRTFEHLGDPIAFVVSLNLHRRHLDTSQRAAVAAKLMPIYEAEAKKRQAAAGGDHRSLGANLPEPIDTSNRIEPEKHKGRARDQAAAAAHVSPRTVQDASKVLEEGAPEVFSALERGEIKASTAATITSLPKPEQALLMAGAPKAILAAAKQIKKEEREAKVAKRTEMHRAIALGNRDLDFGDRRFVVIEADPPWKYNQTGVNGAAGNHYPLMSTDAICQMPVAVCATDHSVLLLWVPNALLTDGLRVMAAWGFEYKTNFAWHKDGAGTGFYNFQDHELLLVGVRGGLITPVERFSSVIQAPKGEHSEKPEEVYLMIERMYPESPRLGLFRRGQREGWESWGNQAESEPTAEPDVDAVEQPESEARDGAASLVPGDAPDEPIEVIDEADYFESEVERVPLEDEAMGRPLWTSDYYEPVAVEEGPDGEE
jgi:N6-adenosine-specific RNA methylase IME4